MEVGQIEEAPAHIGGVNAWRARFEGRTSEDGPFTVEAVVVDVDALYGRVVPSLVVPLPLLDGVVDALQAARRGKERVVPVRMPRTPGEMLRERQRFRVATLDPETLPTTPGVYAWFRGEDVLYVARAAGRRGLRGGLLISHLRTDGDLSRSALRRNAAEYLALAPSSWTRTGMLDDEATATLNEWLAGCDISWIGCRDAAEAMELEQALREELRPVLNRA